MFWSRPKNSPPAGWSEPTVFKPKAFDEWFELAQNDTVGPHDPHYYLRVNANTGMGHDYKHGLPSR